MTDPEATSSPVEAAAAEHDAKPLLAQLGGVSGIVYSSLPVLVFALVSSLLHLGVVAAVASAVSVAALVLLLRLIRRESVQPAVSGFIGVAVCALVALAAGESRGYFLLGIWTSLFWAVVFGLSVLIRRPVVGYLWSWATKVENRWREVRRARLAFDLATLTWVLVFGSRFVVQRLLYEAHQTGWLGVARLAMGWPLAGVAALATYLAVKAARRAIDAVDPAPPALPSAPEVAAD
ncbi:MAG TPA: DUF3159 domain-containing protein [Mycobacterium sp.]|nr:DUF3159 domain-containing protein [Mycobacterium sp.]